MPKLIKIREVPKVMRIRKVPRALDREAIPRPAKSILERLHVDMKTVKHFGYDEIKVGILSTAGKAKLEKIEITVLEGRLEGKTFPQIATGLRKRASYGERLRQLEARAIGKIIKYISYN